MALAAGLLYGINLVPFQRWYQSQSNNPDINPLVCLLQYCSSTHAPALAMS
jgi:hypothetical protein